MMQIISVYGKNILDETLRMQRAVFEKFGLSVTQLFMTHGHAGTIDDFLKDYKWQYIVIFDIDAIPLKRGVVGDLLEMVADGNTIAGIAQRANHKNDKVYVGPSCMAFSMKFFNDIGRPSFGRTRRADVGGELTYRAEVHGKSVKFIMPTRVEHPCWKLTEDIMFGLGTTYEDKVYHAFSTRREQPRFIRRCRELLASEAPPPAI